MYKIENQYIALDTFIITVKNESGEIIVSQICNTKQASKLIKLYQK